MNQSKQAELHDRTQVAGTGWGTPKFALDLFQRRDAHALSAMPSVGETIRVEAGGPSDLGVYFARIQSIAMRKIVLELTDLPTINSPNALDRSFDFLPNAVLNISYERTSAFYSFQAYIVSPPRGNLISVSRPRQITRVQRRNYYRLPLQSPTTLRLLGNVDGGASTAVAARLVNLSGGGAMLSVGRPITSGTRALLRIPTGRNGELIDVLAESLECRNVSQATANAYLVRFRFAGPPMLDNDDREAIIAYIFEQQRMLLRLRRLVAKGI